MIARALISLVLIGTQPDLPDPLVAGWEGEKVCELVRENERVRVLRCTFPPGVGHEKHRHAPHWGYILKGGIQRISDANGTREIETKEGAEWWSDGTVHEVMNTGETTTEYLIVEPKMKDTD
ncbi:cupin domain-containing protein [Parvularcula marina]|uniref:Cupin domain-containing protein n=1 Tax=Parvularcula marina TaxID=2292771 RepID=A0A371RFK5_9PROT|nr:cupin domain-containing protein [Parvularcula marina]RFB04210.1 cupin domain-containing protein [Parvularcula marina]